MRRAWRIVMRPQIVVLGLQAADDGVATPDGRESATVDIEREGSQGLLPGSFAICVTDAVNVTSDRVTGLAHDDCGRGVPTFDRKRHDDPVTQLWPSSEAARFALEIEWPARDQFKTCRAH